MTTERCCTSNLLRGMLMSAAMLAMAACDAGVNQGQSTAAADDMQMTAAATVVYYDEAEGNQEPYSTRIIVTDKYLRLDYGRDDDDFVLLDREQGTMHSTNQDNRTILVIQETARPVESPIPLQVSLQQQALPDAPAIMGRQAVQHTIVVNDKDCYHVVAVAGLMEDVVDAMREYRSVLASEHRRIINTLPADVHEACDLAHNVFHPQQQLAFGIPVQEWDEHGYRRTLTGFEQDIPVRPQWFQLPDGYHSYYMDVSGSQP